MAYRVKVNDKYVKDYEEYKHIAAHIEGAQVCKATSYTDDIEQAVRVDSLKARLIAYESGGTVEGIRGRERKSDKQGNYSGYLL